MSNEARDVQETAQAIADLLARRGDDLLPKMLLSISRRLSRMHSELAVELNEPMF